jgi:hypothetical protein
MKEVLGWLIIYGGLMWVFLPMIYFLEATIKREEKESYLFMVAFFHTLTVIAFFIAFTFFKLLYWCFS